MSFNTLTVQNEAGQVVSFGFDSDDPTSQAREEILRQRIARGELAKVSKGTKSAKPGFRAPVEDYQTGIFDEKGDLLKSVHGGGLDPDADGDALGQPSGSKAVDGAVTTDTKVPVGDSHPSAGAIEQPVEVPDPDGAATAGVDGSAPAKRTAKRTAPTS